MVPNWLLLSRLAQRWLLWGMPENLLLGRHGQSEGNVAYQQYEDGRLSAETLEHLAKRPGHEYRLTNVGQDQVRALGRWCGSNIRFRIHRAICSTHTRAEESAGEFSLAAGWDLEWMRDPWQSERCWGTFETFNPCGVEEYREFRQRLRANPLHLAPPGGESLLTLGSRACRRQFDTLHRECSRQNVVIICHGEVMWMYRFILEHMTPQQFLELEHSKDRRASIPNAALLHYTRRDPQTGKLSRSFSHVRQVVPWDMNCSWDWKVIQHQKFTAEALLADVANVPQLIA